jgi:hypothetical protein
MKLKIRQQAVIQWRNIHTKFRENRPTGSKVNTGGDNKVISKA